MRIWTTLWLAATLAALPGPEAWSATLVTPALEGGSGSSGVTCTAVNVSTKVREVGVEIFDDAGTSVASQAPAALDPRKALTVDSTTPGGPARYCVISVKGGKRSVRGAIYVRQDGNSVGSAAAE